MLDAGGGCIVNNASLNALRPLPGEAPYSAAKAGLVNLTMTAALEYAPTIRVNCVSPGLIDTPLTTMVTVEPRVARRGEAGHADGDVSALRDDVAAVIAFLCSDAAAYITGQNIVIDGGSGLPNLQADSLLRTIMASLSSESLASHEYAPPGPLAHRVEQETFNLKVPGSSPGRPTTRRRRRLSDEPGVVGLVVARRVAHRSGSTSGPRPGVPHEPWCTRDDSGCAGRTPVREQSQRARRVPRPSP